MRSFLLVSWGLLVSVWVVSPACAQGFEPGGHVAINATTFTGEADNDFGYRGAFGAGLSFGIPISDDFMLQPELRYVLKGASVDNASIEEAATEVDARFSVSYIEVPVLLIYRFGGGGIRPRLFGGVYAARKLDATIRFRPAGGGTWQSGPDDSVVDNDYGLVVGGGAEVDVAGEGLLFGARASFGITDVRDTPEAPLRNMGFEVFLGMILR